MVLDLTEKLKLSLEEAKKRKMSLENYKDKRNFKKTPEPAADKNKESMDIQGSINSETPGFKYENSKNRKLEFVIHKHYASHLHFDLRLELDGVLKSWAMPKGPTINPKEKKLAVMVEDHPLEYKEFEGIIPDGSYGAGQVYVWDSGNYHSPGIEDREKSSELLRQGIEKGHLTFILEGNLMKGEFALVRLKKASPKDWLFIKKNDEFASDADISLIKAPAEDKKNNKVNASLSSATVRATLTNPDKVFWPVEKYTKNDLFEYYKKISSFILPYIKDRLQSLNRCPDGISGECFYQKDIDYKLPHWLKTKRVYTESKNEYTSYLICRDLDSLLYMVNLGCIDIHPWSSKITKLEKPDFAILDLDPLDVNFKTVIRVAIEAGKLFKETEIKAYCKTSGSKGMHIYIPLGAGYSFEQTMDFMKIIAVILNDRLPDLTSLDRSPDKRHNKVYLDCYQNRMGQTVAAPYCIRPRNGAPVSTPLSWEELDENLTPGDFNIRNIFRRLDKTGDLWEGILGPGVDMKQCIDKLEAILKK